MWKVEFSSKDVADTAIRLPIKLCDALINDPVANEEYKNFKNPCNHKASDIKNLLEVGLKIW